jgi:hypothetical protein
MNPPAENSPEPKPDAPPTPPPVITSATEPTIDPSKLSPEEQMALFEKDLKENDWGHQPC